MKDIIIANEEIKEEILYWLNKESDEEIDKITEENVKGLKKIELNYIKNDDYSFLKYFTNLKEIEVDSSSLTSIEFLQVLPNLEYISILNNQVKDISSLDTFKNLKELDIRYNDISNIDVLSSLKKLEEVYLRGNKVKDILPLKGLDIKRLCICGLTLNQEECDLISSFENLKEICGHDSTIKGKLKFSKSLYEVDFYRVNTSLMDYSALDTVCSLSAPEDRILSDFSHINKLLSLHINRIDLSEDMNLLEEFIYKKDLQFLHVVNLSFEEYEEISRFRDLKITTDNKAVLNYILVNNKLINWHYSSFDKDDVHKEYCQHYIQKYLLYIDYKEGFVSHILYLKKLYLSIKLAYEDKYYNYVPFGKIENLYSTYMEKYEHSMTSYQRAKFKEFYAYLVSNRRFESLEEENKEIIYYLEKSLEEYESEFVYYKIIYFYLQIKEYKKAFKYFKKIDNKYDYNYYFGYYELIMMNKFEARIDLKINTIEYFLKSFNSFSNIEMELIYNFVLLEYLKNKTNSITLSYDTVEPELDKEAIELMVKNKIYDELNRFIKGDENVDEVYENLISKEEIKDVINRYEKGMKKVIQGKLMIQDIVQFEIIKRGHWEEENPI